MTAVVSTSLPIEKQGDGFRVAFAAKGLGGFADRSAGADDDH
jgi:hypothetical protein